MLAWMAVCPISRTLSKLKSLPFPGLYEDTHRFIETEQRPNFGVIPALWFDLGRGDKLLIIFDVS